MKFDFWRDNDSCVPIFSDDIWQACLEANGLDSPNAIVIDPNKLDWPDGADTAILAYYEGERAFVKMSMKLIISRPAPAWQPKDGDPVFVNASIDKLGKIIKKDGEAFIVRRQNGDEERWCSRSIKPFDPAKIGKPWSEI